jgi:flavin reductase (DIM6/NTAB) family NADH-FMN oxidoreductase RutF
MPKVTLGPRTLLYPLPTILVGANVDGKPNFMAAAWCGIVNSSPPMLSVSLNRPGKGDGLLRHGHWRRNRQSC